MGLGERPAPGMRRHASTPCLEGIWMYVSEHVLLLVVGTWKHATVRFVEGTSSFFIWSTSTAAPGMRCRAMRLRRQVNVSVVTGERLPLERDDML